MARVKEVRPIQLFLLPAILLYAVSPQIQPMLSGGLIMEIILFVSISIGAMIGWLRSRSHTVHQDPINGKIVTQSSITSMIIVLVLIAVRVFIGYLIDSGYLLPHHSDAATLISNSLLIVALANVVTTRIMIYLDYNRLIHGI
ncbi:CcdC protein domain-containing protein [Paenibacillus bovis]|uniref:DUF1453 domain-containing protein n=1 Tax=Paenibacillus bovis TaxID=1616788 RepID=A0A172ZI92_9BACL|nr:CcdC protein domain-containing protein [Paenibacillus bovis]ANF96860.1 hypothetical protein AR543_13135 [Paenibacillus bovis]